MDGIRMLARSSLLGLSFLQPVSDSFAAIEISPSADGYEFQLSDIQQGNIRGFLRNKLDGDSQRCPSDLRIFCVPIDGRKSVFINKTVFLEILEELESDMWVENLISTGAYGLYHSAHVTSNSISTYFLRTSFGWTLWTVRQEKSRFSTKGLILYRTGDELADASMTFSYLSSLMSCLEAFKVHAGTPLYLPFVIAVDALRWREEMLSEWSSTIQDIESKTGHGPWASGVFDMHRDEITSFTARLGSALNTIGNTYKHLNIVESTLSNLSKLSIEIPNGDEFQMVGISNESVRSATKILLQQSFNIREHAQYFEL
jgi:hypothetical protein